MKNLNLKKIKTRIVIFSVIFSYHFSEITMGATHTYPGVENPFPEGGGGLLPMIKTMINGLLKLAVPFLILGFVYVGFLFVKAQGSTEGLKKAKAALIWALVGAALIIGANTIYSVVTSTIDSATTTDLYEINNFEKIC